ncbi:hypothetical protein ACLBX9_30955 [Methylobacterium sp. A49B]|uniref:Uncharacterized protein n=1 Tax=Methylobacterium mesophilicum SR1.6/6 TaxID=908290 RepID=A0A6B9FQ32_9HYPH|nr:hypothetical protein [Methylobacterium mesophilicum]QGY04680.1 hypothetical protein MMSR116_24285 [Methylobacterium mesophilicum SR1.6/6]
MIYLLTATIGMIIARWLNWFSLAVITMVFSTAIGIEGALHARPFLTVLQRGLEVNATLQGAYLGQAILLVFGPRLLRRSGK